MSVAKKAYEAHHAGRYVSRAVLVALGHRNAKTAEFPLFGDALPGAMIAKATADRIEGRGTPRESAMSTAEVETKSDEEVFQKLAEPFHASEIRTRNQGGRQLSYITARTARKRLNEAVGASMWECRVEPGPDGVKCRLTIELPSGRPVTREAMGGYPDMPSTEDRVKGADSDAFKRACVLFGIGEYLYGDETAFVDGAAAPSRPSAPIGRPTTRPDGDGSRTQGHGRGQGGSPQTGKALFAWTRDKEAKSGVSLLSHLNDWSKRKGFPSRMIDWDQAQVAEGHAEAVRKLGALQSQEPDIPEQDWPY